MSNQNQINVFILWGYSILKHQLHIGVWKNKRHCGIGVILT